jgi:DNA modification methylase
MVMILEGNCLDEMKKLDDNSVDSIVTDPPYGLSFMGKKWDYEVPSVAIWREALRVLKPGGHLLSFAGSRTYHRMAVNIEDAGFEIRDQIMWIYGSGFPKSHNISKAIDKHLGAERELIRKPFSPQQMMMKDGQNERPWQNKAKELGYHETASDEPASPEAKQWQGWGTALKPAHEPIVVARKPLEGTVAENILEHGVGGINIDESRVGEQGGTKKSGPPSYIGSNALMGGLDGSLNGGGVEPIDGGRFPANIILDAEAGAMLDEQSGESKAVKSNRGIGFNDSGVFGDGDSDFDTQRGFDDGGGASRYFKEVNFSKQEHTPIVLARKPIEGTVAENVLEHGVGGLNIDESRVKHDEPDIERKKMDSPLGMFTNPNREGERGAGPAPEGRFPANIIHDGSEEVVEGFPDTKSGDGKPHHVTRESQSGSMSGKNYAGRTLNTFGDEGSAARFFYCAKASTGERNEGLEGFDDSTSKNSYNNRVCSICEKHELQSNIERRCVCENPVWGSGILKPTKNIHPTVKPIALMEYLCRLITPKGGTVLDPFMGSGTTGIAATRLGFEFIGIEMTPEYIELAATRIAYWSDNELTFEDGDVVLKSKPQAEWL